MTRRPLVPALMVVSLLAAASAPAAPPVEVEGDFEVIQVDDFTGPGTRIIHRLRDQRTGELLEIDLPGRADELRTGMRVRVRGQVVAGVVRGRSRVLAASADPGAVEVLEAPVAAAVTGQRRAVTLVVDFLQDGKTVACTDAAIAGKMFTADPSVDRLYQQTSFGQLSWASDTDGNGQPDVLRVAIDDAGNDCDDGAWRSKADAAATAGGVNLGLYQHRVYVLPSSVGCSWAGYAQIGCGSACWSMVSTCDRGDVYAHELGHNLGMHHASFDADNNGAVDGSCPWGAWSGGGEYCDDSDFMGISTNVWRQVNGPHKNQMGWVPADRIVDVTVGGTYTIAPLETDPGATALPLLLRVAKPSAGTSYYLSYRRRIGYDANMRSSYADRTSVHTHTGSGRTLMVDFLGDGETYQDATNGITFTQVAHDTASVAIQVTRTCGNGVLDPGEECDGASLGGATCGGCAGLPGCTTSCRLDLGPCTNGVCDPAESCQSCADDCVQPGAACGDGVCQAGNGESCVTCPVDCDGRQSGKPSDRFCCGFGGSNPVGCDPGRCGACTTQSIVVCCGDGVCSPGETASTCARDCSGCGAEVCTGGADEDCDGGADCADADCASHPACAACTDADGDGWCVEEGDCNDANPGVNPGAAEVCASGGDEDCDGLANCADPGCATDPACTTCKPAGAACTLNTECCSASCTGKPRRKTCR